MSPIACGIDCIGKSVPEVPIISGLDRLRVQIEQAHDRRVL